MKKITVYSKNACASCMMVKKWLHMKQAHYEEINTDEHPETLEYVMKISGAATLPVVLIEDDQANNQTISIGYKPGQLAAALGA
ncbi:MAG TPA: glutaredoxin family protein [Candidatus Saccharimonadales bacterium]